MENSSQVAPVVDSTQQASTTLALHLSRRQNENLARRNASLDIIWKQTLVSAGLALFGVGVGIGIIVLVVEEDSEDGRWRFTGGSLIPATLLAVSGILGYFLCQIGREKERQFDIGAKARNLFILQHVCNVTVFIAALFFTVMSIPGIIWCTEKSANGTCNYNETAIIVTACLALVDCVAIAVCSFVGLALYVCYSDSYGIKTKRRGY